MVRGNPNPLPLQNRNHKGFLFPLSRAEQTKTCTISAGQGRQRQCRSPLEVSPVEQHVYFFLLPQRTRPFLSSLSTKTPPLSLLHNATTLACRQCQSMSKTLTSFAILNDIVLAHASKPNPKRSPPRRNQPKTSSTTLVSIIDLDNESLETCDLHSSSSQARLELPPREHLGPLPLVQVLCSKLRLDVGDWGR